VSLLLLFSGAGVQAAVVVPPVVTPTGVQESGLAGGGRVPIERVPARRRAKVKPLPYWVGLNITFTGPAMPSFTAEVSWRGPEVTTSAPKAHVVYTPRPRLPEPPPAWIPRKLPARLRASIAFRGPGLPQFAMSFGVWDMVADDEESMAVLIRAFEAYE